MLKFLTYIVYIPTMRDHCGMKQTRTLLLTATAVYATALLLTVTLHEFGHSLAALLVGQHPTMYGTLEQDYAGSSASKAFILGAGPIVSLLLGLAFLYIARRSAARTTGSLLLTWLGLYGLETFFGYLLTAPFLPTGDIAQFIATESLPSGLVWLCFAIGIMGIVALGRLALARLLPFTTPQVPLRPQLLSLGMFPWILGSIVVLIATLPWQYGAWPIAVVAGGLFTPLINFNASKLDKTKTYGSTDVLVKPATWLFGLLIVLVLLEQTLLRSGIKL